MGQAASGGSISSIFNWSSPSSERDETPDGVSARENVDPCARSPEADGDPSESPRALDVDDDMKSSKKSCKFCNGDGGADRSGSGDSQIFNEDRANYYETVRALTAEINGNRIDSAQSCSFENSNIRTRNVHSTSINRYVNTFTERMEKVSLRDEPRDDAEAKAPRAKSKEFKRSCKQKKCAFRECNGCVKESKSNNKLGAKKKNGWIKFYGSKLGKGNNNRTSANSSCAPTSDTDSGCVCTSYRRVDESNKRESEADADAASSEAPLIHHNLSFGWACERPNIGRNSGINFSAYTGGPVINPPPVRSAECISCEGSHCHMDLNALAADISNIRRMPLNITVTRFETNRSHSTPSPAEKNVIVVSLGPQKFPVIDLKRFFSRLNPEVHIEDCEVRARVQRAFEIAEGVDPPPGYNSAQTVNPGELRALLFQQPSPASTSISNQPAPQRARIHTQVDYIHCLVPDLRSIISCSFYWGKMDRYEAERLLDGKPEGTFLLRDSAQEEYLFSVSFRKYQRSLHARIEQFNHKFSFDSHDPCVFASDTVTGLIEHYKDPTCVMFFEPMLTVPLSRTFTFPLQHLCRAVIVSCTTYDGINELKLPPGIKAYLKEYHYRQRVRVKRFDESPESSEESQ